MHFIHKSLPVLLIVCLPLIGQGQADQEKELEQLEKEIRQAEKNGNSEKVRELEKEYDALAERNKGVQGEAEDKLSDKEELKQELQYARKQGDEEEVKALKERMKEAGHTVPSGSSGSDAKDSAEKQGTSAKKEKARAHSKREELEKELEYARKKGDEEEVKALERELRELEQEKSDR